MNFSKGNLALKNHVANGRQVFLFTYVQKGAVKFETEVELHDFDYFIAPDKDGNERKAIKFFFKRKGAIVPYLNERRIIDQNLEETLGKGYIDTPNETERQGLITSRVGQGAYRKSILHRWEYKCAVTDYNGHEILIASHIVPWRDANNEERLHVGNGILLSPVYDALFDRHLISFENNGTIIVSDVLSGKDLRVLGISGTETIRRFNSENYAYLERHRLSLRK